MKTPLFDSNNWSEITSTLARNKTRTFLTALGIFWGTAMLAMLWGGAHGLEGLLKRNFAHIDPNIGGISSSRRTMSYKGFNRGTYWMLNDDDLDNIRSVVPHIHKMTGVYYYWSRVAYNDKTDDCQVLGVDGNYEDCSKPVIISGRFINDRDNQTEAKVGVLGKDLAVRLFGDEDPVGQLVNVRGIFVRVVGVVAQRGQGSIGGDLNYAISMPRTSMRKLYKNGARNIDFIALVPDAGYKVRDLEPMLRRVIRANNHYLHPEDTGAITIFDMSEMFETVDKLFLGVSLLALIVGAGSLLAGIIGVGNIMWIIVKERTKEIGIRRAIGAKPGDIITQILCESMFLTAVAGTAGICFASIVLTVADRILDDPILGSPGFVLRFGHAVSILATFLILGTAAGILPALKAMRIKPVQALNDK